MWSNKFNSFEKREYNFKSCFSERVKNYFKVGNEYLKPVDKNLLTEFWELNINKFFVGLINYIETNLKNLPKVYKTKLKLSIIRKFNALELNNFLKEKKKQLQEQIKEKLKEKRDLLFRLNEVKKYYKKHPENAYLPKEISRLENEIKNIYIPKLKDYRWELNQEFQDKFSWILNKILPSLAFYSKYYNQVIEWDNEYKINFWLWKRYKSRIKQALEEIQEMLNAKLDKDGDFDEGFFSTQNILDQTNEKDRKILQLADIPFVKWIDLLSEEDKEKEAKVMAVYMAYVLTMMVPYVGDLTSIPADARDLLTNQDWVLSQLKVMWLVPQDYQMNKDVWNYVFGWAWLVSTVMSVIPVLSIEGNSLNELLRTRKIAKIFEKIEKLWISRQEFLKMLEEAKDKIKGIKKIEVSDYSQLHDVIKKSVSNSKKWKIIIKNNIKKDVYQNLTRNVPLLSIERLSPNSKIYNITFTWGIKKLNDKYGQSNTDLIIKKIQDYFINLNKWNRVVRRNYKHLTIDTLFHKSLNLWLSNSTEVVKHVIKENRNVLKNIYLENKKKDKVKNLKDDFDEFVRDAIENIKIWVGSAEVKWNDLKSKLNAFYQAEISARLNKSNKLEIAEYDAKKIEFLAKISLKLENEIISKYEWKEFIYAWKNYKIITITPEGQKIINPVLIRLVRKDRKLVDINGMPMNELYMSVKKYIDSLNSWFDFIAPYVDLKKEIKFAKKLNKQIRFWSVDIEHFLKDFKWSLPKELFLDYVDWKKWVAYFVDIKDMGILNLIDFRRLAEEVVKKWVENVDLTSSWKAVTEKFISFVRNLKKEYPDLKIALWWDEIYIFSEKLDNLDELISFELHKSTLTWRISKYEWKVWKNTFLNLDKATSIIKQVEDPIEYYFSKLWESIPNIIMEKINWLDLSKRVDEMDINLNIDQNKIKKILDWKKVFLWECEWKELFWKLRNNSLILSF